MPIYEYRCRECGHVTSFLEKAGARKSHACEKCGSGATEKLLSTFAAKTSSASDSGNPGCVTGTCPLP
jgi:putative FmdB family regulatory protein